jgi:hypothetical protein
MPQKKTAARKSKPAHKTPVKTAHASSPYSRKSSPEGRRQLMLLGLIALTAIIFFVYLFAQNAPPTEAAGKQKESKNKERTIDAGKNKNEPRKQQRDGNGKQQSQ